MYATAQELETRLGGGEALVILADRDGDGVADAELVERALTDATAEIDSYLAARYTLPLPTVPAVLVRLACDMAVYRITSEYGAGLTEERRQRYEDAVAWLRRAGSGDVSLGLPPQQAPAATLAAPGLVSGKPRAFDRLRRIM
ncbi:MAG: gp436 family protein [Humidesulfovibrio sp.]